MRGIPLPLSEAIPRTMQKQIQHTQPECGCHYRVVTDAITWRAVYGATRVAALDAWRKIVQPWIDSGLAERHNLFDAYLRNPRAEFVRCPSCSC